VSVSVRAGVTVRSPCHCLTPSVCVWFIGVRRDAPSGDQPAAFPGRRFFLN
jgi:hypothetical protein